MSLKHFLCQFQGILNFIFKCYKNEYAGDPTQKILQNVLKIIPQNVLMTKLFTYYKMNRKAEHFVNK